VTAYVIELRFASGRTTALTVSTDDPRFTHPASGFSMGEFDNGRFTATVTAVNVEGASESSPVRSRRPRPGSRTSPGSGPLTG
jgi:hypothetical protein